MRRLLTVIALLASGCAGAPDTRPINQPLAFAAVPAVTELGVDGEAIAFAFSGGGARAASFSYGVLLELRDMRDRNGQPLIDKVALVTAVSGGSITAAWFGANGPAGLDGFRKAALDKDWQSQLHTSWMSPQNWDRLLQGGLNGPDKLGNWLDKEVFAGARLRDMQTRPLVVINATDLYSGAPFAFAQPWFDAICSDLSSIRVADAVAASMAVPIAFRPIVLRSYTADCPAGHPAWVDATLADRSAPTLLRETARSFRFFRDETRMKYLHLSDGGVADNFGVSSLVTLHHAGGTAYAPFSARDAVRLKRLTFIVVNAERIADGDWAKTEAGPGGPQMIEAIMSAAVNAPKRAALDAFRGFLADWRIELANWRCALTPAEAQSLGAGPDWKCDDLAFTLDTLSFADLGEEKLNRLGGAATAVSLDKALIDDLIAGGREAVQKNAALQRLVR